MASEQRVRISRACNQCRKRKSKCGGEQPQCLTCQSAGRTCTYENNVRKRGLQSGYVRSLEIVLGLVLQHDPQLDIHIQNAINSQTQSGDALTPSRMHALARKWRDSASARGAGESLISTAQTLTESSDAPVINPSGHHDVLHSDSVDCAPRLDDASNVDLGTAPSVPADQPNQTLYTRGLPVSTSELVDAYFVETHCWFPVLRKSDLLRSLYTDLTDVNNMDVRQLGTRLCLWAVIAYVTAGQEIANTAFSPDVIHAQIHSAIAAGGDAYELSHVQALLILVLSQIIQGRFSSAWVTSAQASRMFINQRSYQTLHDDRSTRSFHGCAVLETLVSSILDRTPCFAFRDFQVNNNKLDDESIDEWETWRPPTIEDQQTAPSAKQQPLRSLTIFSLLLELVQKLHLHSTDVEDERSDLGQLTELRHWKESLPSFASISDSRSWTPPRVHLHAMWCYVFCKTAEKMPRESLPEQLVAEAIESTISLIDDYTQQNPRSGCFSLLPCLLMRIIECLSLCGHSTRADMVRRNEHRLHRITEGCKNAHPISSVITAIADKHGDVRDQRSSGMTGAGISSLRTDSHSQQILQNPFAISMATSQSIPEAEVHDLSETQAGVGHDHNMELARYPTTGVSASSVYEFDGCFSPLLPTHRIDEDHIFSQNLGFLGEDLDNHIYGGIGGTHDL